MYRTSEKTAAVQKKDLLQKAREAVDLKTDLEDICRKFEDFQIQSSQKEAAWKIDAKRMKDELGKRDAQLSVQSTLNTVQEKKIERLERQLNEFASIGSAVGGQSGTEGVSKWTTASSNWHPKVMRGGKKVAPSPMTLQGKSTTSDESQS